MSPVNHREIINELLQEGLTRGRKLIFQVISPSMSPLLNIGDKVTLKSASPEELNCGDIVAYKKQDKLIIHRFLLQKPEGTLVLKGDAAPLADAPISPDMLFGKAILIDGKNKKVDLENQKWRITNRLIGRANLLKIENQFPIKPSRLLIPVFSQISAKLLNGEYRRMAQRDTDDIPEKKFLILATKNNLSLPEIKVLEEIIAEGINWRKLLVLALYNNIGPLIYKNLPVLTADAVPETVKESLKSNYTESFLQAAPIYNDISLLLETLKAAGISVILLKGASLSHQLYEDFCLRPLKDVDLLVRKIDWPRIKEILWRLGFHCDLDPLELTSLSGLDSDWHIYFANDRNTKLEIRFNLFAIDFPEFETDGYWEEAIPVEIDRAEGLSLGPEDNLLYLASRLVWFGFGNFLWFCDLREFVNSYGQTINWEKLMVKAKKKRVATPLYYVLSILKEDLETAIPPLVLEYLKPNGLKLKLFKILFSPKRILFQNPSRLNRYPSIMLTLSMFIDKLSLRPRDVGRVFRYLIKSLFPSAKYLRYRYGIKGGSLACLGWYAGRIKIFFGSKKR